MSWDRWIRTVEIEPSLYAADFARLGDQIEILLRAGARVFHFDVGDGHFVEPVTIGPIVLESIAPLIHREGGAIDCHLMVDEPERQFGLLQSAGADSVTFHFEIADDPAALAERRASAASRSASPSSPRRRSRTSRRSPTASTCSSA